MYDPALTNGNSRSLWYSDFASDEMVACSGSELGELGSRTVDVGSIGAGISGLSVAYHLCEQGRSAAVFDKAQLGAGETGRTNAQLSHALDDRCCALEQLSIR